MHSNTLLGFFSNYQIYKLMPSRLWWKGGEQASMEEEQKTDSRSEGEREEAQKTSSFSTTLMAGSGLMD
jgi:hypothetical protein